MPITKQQALDYHCGARPGKIEVIPTKALPDPARPEAGLHPRGGGRRTGLAMKR
jgi:hypothetical protein